MNTYITLIKIANFNLLNPNLFCRNDDKAIYLTDVSTVCKCKCLVKLKCYFIRTCKRRAA